jgi:hypothetical protein
MWLECILISRQERSWGGSVRQLFISYARENKPAVEALIRDLDELGYQTWVVARRG